MTAPRSPGWRPSRASADRYPTVALQAPYGREGLCTFTFYTAHPYHIAPFAFRHREFFRACRGGKKRGTPAAHAKHAPLRNMPVFRRLPPLFVAKWHQAADLALLLPALCATGVRARRGRPPRATCLKNTVKEVFNEHLHAKGKRPGAHAAHQRTTAGT